MRQMRKLPAGILATTLCLVSIGSSGDPAPAEKPAVCTAQPKGPGGLPSTLAQWAEGARLFGELGNFHRQVTTGSQPARTYFDQGMRLLWAFNHDEATRSFAKAAELDPECAMCCWGVSLTVGPNYNLPMMAEPRAVVAWEALQQAQRHAATGSAVEQALIGALAKRYPNAQPLDPSTEGPILVAYANGWSWFGLAQSLQMQGRSADAKMIRQRFDSAWRNSDVKLTASAF